MCAGPQLKYHKYPNRKNACNQSNPQQKKRGRVEENKCLQFSWRPWQNPIGMFPIAVLMEDFPFQMVLESDSDESVLTR